MQWSGGYLSKKLKEDVGEMSSDEHRGRGKIRQQEANKYIIFHRKGPGTLPPSRLVQFTANQEMLS